MLFLVALVCYVAAKSPSESYRVKRRVAGGTNGSVFFDQSRMISGYLTDTSNNAYVGQLLYSTGSETIYGMKVHICFSQQTLELQPTHAKYAKYEGAANGNIPADNVWFTDAVLYRLRQSASDVMMADSIFGYSSNAFPTDGTLSNPIDYANSPIYAKQLYPNRDELYAASTCLVSSDGITMMDGNCCCCLDYNSATDPHWTPIVLGPDESIRFQVRSAALPDTFSGYGTVIHGYFSYALTPP